MSSAQPTPQVDLRKPINLSGRDFAEHKYAYYRRMLEEAPVCPARISVVKLYLVARHADCLELVSDPRFVRNRTTATGGSRIPFPVPKSAALVAQSMIVEDDPAHRRLRSLVNKAFTPRAVARLRGRVEAATDELLNAAAKQGEVDLLQAFALPLPMTVIGEMVGVPENVMPRFRDGMRAFSRGFNPLSLVRMILWDLRAMVRLIRELIEHKRREPADDILSALIQAEEDGDRLSEDEIVSTVALLVVAGFETTAHLISNSVVTLLDHPEQLERLRKEPELIEPAVEEILRHRGPVHGTKLSWATEDVQMHGVTIAKGSAIAPALAAANHDPSVFSEPEVFDIARSPNQHLSFSHGAHFCLGAQLARMETQVALSALFERHPALRLSVPRDELALQRMPLWHRYQSLPIALG